MIQISIDGTLHDVAAGDRLVDAINHAGIPLSQLCYLPILGPIQTCDTCIVEVDGKLVRACATAIEPGMRVSTTTGRSKAARIEAFDRMLRDHDLYCTVCDNNNGNCTVHNTTKLLDIDHQSYPFQPKPYEIDNTNPFYRYDSQSMRPVRPLRGGMPGSRGQRNAVHPLGRSQPSRSLGWRCADRRIELRLVRPLRDGLPVQCPHGKGPC